MKLKLLSEVICVLAVYLNNFCELLAYISASLEWRRVLRPGGLLFLAVPDLLALSQLFVEPSFHIHAHAALLSIIFGGHKDQFDYHVVSIAHICDDIIFLKICNCMYTIVWF